MRKIAIRIVLKFVVFRLDVPLKKPMIPCGDPIEFPRASLASCLEDHLSAGGDPSGRSGTVLKTIWVSACISVDIHLRFSRYT